MTGSGTISAPLECPTVRLSFSGGSAHARESSPPGTGAQVVSGDLALDFGVRRPNLAGRLVIPGLGHGPDPRVRLSYKSRSLANHRAA